MQAVLTRRPELDDLDLDAMVQNGDDFTRRDFLRITGLLAMGGIGALLIPQDAQAGGSGAFYYGTRYSAKVGTYYIQGTNYRNNAGGQTYHVAMKGVPSGYYSNFWTFNGVVYLRGALGGYVNFSNQYTDHTIIGYIRNSAGYAYSATIPASRWA